MEKIELNQISLEKLRKISGKKNLESNIYHDGSIAYKIFKNMSKEALDIKERKIELLDAGDPLPKTVMPISKIVSGDLFSGYSLKYIKDTRTLYVLYTKTKDINLFFQILSIVSETVEKIHQDPRNIIIGDLHLDNILVDNDFNPYFIDIDSCQIDRIPNETIPSSLGVYRYNRALDWLDATKSQDRLCLVLCSLGLIFKKHIDFVSLREYDKKAEEIETLRNMRELVLEIKKSKGIPNMPYIHELIASSDTVRRPNTRKKIQVNIRKRI